jgi:predicted double-glycine peptidase
MHPLIETLVVVLVALSGVAIGRWCSRLRRPFWSMAYFVPLVLLAIIGVARWNPRLEFVLPFQWIMADRTEFVVLALILTVLLTTLIFKLPRKRPKSLLSVLLFITVTYFCVLPFLLPALLQGHLSQLETEIDDSGVCLQSNGYTCGPAAAVTALRSLGIQAEEGELAVAAHTTPIDGTQPDSLCAAIYREYGVTCRYESFKSVAELRGKEPVIALVKFGFMVDHYVTVLAVTDSQVIVGDPLKGRVSVTHEEFDKKWRKCGIVIDLTGS